MGKPKQLEIIYKNGVPKIYLSGKKIKIASKKNNKSYKKNRVPKKKCERKIELRVPKRRILWGEVRNWFKKRTGHSQECKSKKGTLRQDKNEIGLKKLPRKLLLKNTRTR